MSASLSHIIWTPQTARANEITVAFRSGLLFEINCWICAPPLQCSSVNAIQMIFSPCKWNGLRDFIATVDEIKLYSSAESIKPILYTNCNFLYRVIKIIGLTSRSYSRSTNQRAAWSLPGLCVWCHLYAWTRIGVELRKPDMVITVGEG